jgi:hypothetical protein
MFVRPTSDLSDVEGARLQSQFESLRTRAEGARGEGTRRVRGVESARELYESASTPEEKKIRETSDEFVSILYGLLFKQMESTVERSGFLDGGKTEEMFRSFTLDEYAKTASSQNANPPTAFTRCFTKRPRRDGPRREREPRVRPPYRSPREIRGSSATLRPSPSAA